ncbi:MAG TPA: alpha/beta hydrolase [Polyangiaceae bacterium]|nr:alpha/beta hydrolase [Polyangiaceae bacterium]
MESVDVTTGFGVTHMQVCGPTGGTPLVLIPGGGATSAVWFANVGELSQNHRVYAIDPINDVGRSEPSGPPIRDRSGLMQWLDEVFAGLGLYLAKLCGHSYGGWVALNYAMHAPQRVSRLALLDPTDCFAGLSLRYRLHALAVVVRPDRRRMRALLHWETGGRSIDSAWLDLISIGSELPRPRIVLPRRPATEELRAMGVPTLVLVAEHSRAHDSGRLAERASELMRDVQTAVLRGASHHSIPTEDPEQLNRELTQFFS